jgi:hypothetical protein
MNGNGESLFGPKEKGLEKDIMKENGEINRKNNLDKEEIWVQNEESEPDNFIIVQSRKKKRKKDQYKDLSKHQRENSVDPKKKNRRGNPQIPNNKVKNADSPKK